MRFRIYRLTVISLYSLMILREDNEPIEELAVFDFNGPVPSILTDSELIFETDSIEETISYMEKDSSNPKTKRNLDRFIKDYL